MGKLKTDHSGFGIIEIVLIVVVITLLGGAGWLIYTDNYKTTSSSSSQQAVVDGSVSVGLNLDKYTVTAGSTISGTVNIINRTAKPLNSGFCSGQRPEAGLQNSKFVYTPIVTTQACELTIKLNPGNNYFNIQIITQACNYAANQPELSQFKCTTTYTSNLPSGVYEVVVWLYGCQGIKNSTIIMPARVTLI